jgi:hypothetical protein
MTKNDQAQGTDIAWTPHSHTSAALSGLAMALPTVSIPIDMTMAANTG